MDFKDNKEDYVDDETFYNLDDYGVEEPDTGGAAPSTAAQPAAPAVPKGKGQRSGPYKRLDMTGGGRGWT